MKERERENITEKRLFSMARNMAETELGAIDLHIVIGAMMSKEI